MILPLPPSFIQEFDEHVLAHGVVYRRTLYTEQLVFGSFPFVIFRSEPPMCLLLVCYIIQKLDSEGLCLSALQHNRQVGTLGS